VFVSVTHIIAQTIVFAPGWVTIHFTILKPALSRQQSHKNKKAPHGSMRGKCWNI
jgi:hypothetical protein